MPKQRKYIPEIGKLVKLASIYDYTQHLPALGYWSNLTVRAIDGDQVKVEHYNAGDTGEFFTVPLAAIEKPVGWEPRYTIPVSADEVDMVLSWFKRGIVCRLTHDLNQKYMPMVFQPLGSDPPSWRFPEITDKVLPEDCDEVFRVVKIEKEEVDFDTDAKGRTKFIKEWAKDGWVTAYDKDNRIWSRTRETIVKDWSEEDVKTN